MISGTDDDDIVAFLIDAAQRAVAAPASAQDDQRLSSSVSGIVSCKFTQAFHFFC